MRHEKERFANQTVEIDGHEFVECTFDNCKLLYKGGGLPSIVNCSFNGWDIAFEGAAANTLELLSGLYHGGFQQVIETTFQNIRRNALPRSPIIG